jgi:Zn finger protein HypA/HybF involved in hydrogenase expression
MAETQYSKEFWVHCGLCGHGWIAFYVPMMLSKLKRFRFACPKCGAKQTDVFCGKKDGTHG